MENLTSVVTLDGPEYARALRSAVGQANLRVWTVQFLIDARSQADVDGSVLGHLHALAAASARGVDVRVILPLLADEGASDLNAPAALFLRARGVDVRYYLPTRNRPYLHSKYSVVDGRMGFVGNCNWSPRGLGRETELTLGFRSHAICGDLERDFEALWGLSYCIPSGPLTGRRRYHDSLPARCDPRPRRTSLEYRIMDSGPIAGVSGGRILRGQRYVREISALIEAARSRVLVAMCGLRASTSVRLHGLLRACATARQQGRDVRVLYDGERAMRTDWAADVPALRAIAVEARPWVGPGRLHTRAVIVDDQLCVGSVGWTPQSVFITEECSLLIQSPPSADAFATGFNRAWVRCP